MTKPFGLYGCIFCDYQSEDIFVFKYKDKLKCPECGKIWEGWR